jgi:hypothetical protein
VKRKRGRAFARPRSCNGRYSFFFSGSWVAPPEEPALDPLLLGELLELLLGELALGLEELGLEELELGGVLDAPPEADPDAEPEADPLDDFEGSVALGELDELGELEEELGELEAPLEGDVDDEELEPELDGGGVALPELLLDELPFDDFPASSPQAARPSAIATAIAKVESFMCPPWLECSKRARSAPGLTP